LFWKHWENNGTIGIGKKCKIKFFLENLEKKLGKIRKILEKYWKILELIESFSVKLSYISEHNVG
jgi:hypothetical protein